MPESLHQRTFAKPGGSSDLHPAAASTPQIPDHELLGPIASGAYGEVWLARNAVGALRAVKIVRRDRHALSESFEREFKGLQKFEPISRTHEGLVDILTLGLLPDEAGFYYVMELADDANGGQASSLSGTNGGQADSETGKMPVLPYSPRTLRAELKSRGALPADEAIALGLKLTAALAHLHAQGLVHRDVKPSNILFIGGEPKLADAGLVAAMDDAQSLVGTAGYIAPEGPGTPQADLYALGKVFYEVAFGKDRQEFPALPADVASRPDHARLLELNAVLLKACAGDARQRYQSADEVRADLELLRVGQSVKRRRAWQRTSSYTKKLALAVSAIAVITVVPYWLTVGHPPPPDFQLSKNEEANLEYRQGVQVLHAGNNGHLAIKHFENAIALDPGFAEAYARLALVYVSGADEPKDAPERARSAAQQAVKLNPNSSYAHAALASVKVLFDLDWAAAEKERKLAIKLNARGGNPNSEEILLESALNLVMMGKSDDALAFLKEAQARTDSPSVFRFRYFGFVYEWSRQFDEAIKTYDRYIEVSQSAQAEGHEFQARAYLGKGDYTNAIHFGRLAALESGEDAASVKARFDRLENAFNESGSERFWRVQLEMEESKRDDGHAMRMAAILARLKRSKQAFEYLYQAREKTPAHFCWINVDPSFDGLRQDGRFQEMIYELWHKK